LIVTHAGKSPTIDPTAFIAPNATLCGDVTIGPNTSVGFNAVITAETGPVVIGSDCVIMENAIIRGLKHFPTTIGDKVLVGPHTHLTGCTVEDCVYIATGATIYDGAHVGQGAKVDTNAVVYIGAKIGNNATLHASDYAIGDPAEFIPVGNGGKIKTRQAQYGFPARVFKASQSSNNHSVMDEIMPRLAGKLVTGHRADVVTNLFGVKSKKAK